MGVLSASEIISTALNLAGNTGLGTPAFTWLNVWLREVASRHVWPQFSPFVDATMTTGTGYVDIGNGTTQRVMRVLSVMYAGPTNGQGTGDIPISDARDLTSEGVPEWISTTSRGGPSRFFVTGQGTAGVWRLYSDVVPDRAYRLRARVMLEPAPLAFTTDIPWYPNDQTMIDLVVAKALFHQNDERWLAEEAKVNRQVATDFVTYGKGPGHKRWNLDRHVFGNVRSWNPWRWMGD